MTRLVIVGAGVVGATLAARLAGGPRAQDFDITVVDAAPRPGFDPGADVDLRVSAISIGSAALLDRVGAWPTVAAQRCCAYDHMRVWDEDGDADGPATLTFDADEFAVPHLGYIVENRLLTHALLGVLDAADVAVRFDAALDVIRERDDGFDVVLEDGSRLPADLIVAADGAQSKVREAVGIDVQSHAYEQQAIVTHAQPELAHGATAWQRFLRTGPIGLLPLDDGRVSIVWSVSADLAQRASEASDEELGELLTDASDAVLGELQVAAPRAAFPLVARHADRYVTRGVALVGDAAHSVHPLAGQGANLGLTDADELARVLEDAAGRGEHVGDRPVLRRYERARRGENAAMLHFMTGLNSLFASDSVLLGELRKAGMALFNRSGPLRRRMVGVALGGDRR